MPLLSKARSPQRKAVPVGAAGGSERNGCRWEASPTEKVPILGDKTTVSRFESWSNSTLIYAFDFVKAK